MTCLEVRGRLAEHSLGLLTSVDARAVERHLEWCPGCRKESGELQEGATMMALSLPEQEPPAGLGSRIVDRITSASAPSRAPSRVRIRVLAAATLAALLVAMGSIGWAIAEREQVQDIRQVTAEQINKLKDLQKILDDLEANPIEATLFPILDVSGSGRVLIYSSPDDDDFILAAVSLVEPASRRYTVELTDRSGRVLSGGALLDENNNGVLLFYEESGKNLSRGTSVTVLDDSGLPVMHGVVEPAAEA